MKIIVGNKKPESVGLDEFTGYRENLGASVGFTCPNCLWENELRVCYCGRRIECLKCCCTWIGPKFGEFPDTRELYDKKRREQFKEAMAKYLIPNELEKALVVKQPWVDLILSGQKIWEMRSTKTANRGLVGLIQSGTSKIIGSCEIIDVHYIPSLEELMDHQDKHQIDFSDEGLERCHYAWIIENPKRFTNPIPYSHPHGAVIWVNL